MRNIGLIIIALSCLFVTSSCIEGVDDDVDSAATTSELVATGEPVVTQGGCSSFPPTPCGELQNNSGITVRVSLNWTCTASSAPLGSSCPQSIVNVAPHTHKGGGSVDVDAFEVPSGCSLSGDINGTKFSRTAGWYKFSSLQTVTVASAGCGGGGCAVFPCIQ